MIVTPKIYFGSVGFNLGVEYDRTEPDSFSAEYPLWMSSQIKQQDKEEPRDDSEYMQERSLTPPSTSVCPRATASKEEMPLKDLSSVLPSQRDHLDNCSTEEEFGDSHMQLASKKGVIAEEKLKCPVCKFTCSVRSEYNEHLRIHIFKCSGCEYNAESATNLKEHLKTVHGVDDSENSIEKDPNKLNMNAQGKVKTFTCRHCPFTVITKIQLWNHLRTHIKPERILMCPCCEFVTEYKHHLEYHLRNHWKHKPYSCDKCPYRCVNKSMLSSHMKSHSNVYQYRCINCNYATKYCHSLKTHLKKYDREPGMVLSPDGSPDSSRKGKRGPKNNPKRDPKPDDYPNHFPNIFHHYYMMLTQMHKITPNTFESFSCSGYVDKIETDSDIRDQPLDLSFSNSLKVNSNHKNLLKKIRKEKPYQMAVKKVHRPGLQQQVGNELRRHEQEQQVGIGKEFEKQKTLVQQQETQTAADVGPPHLPEIEPCEAGCGLKADMTEVKINYTCVYCGLGFNSYALYKVHMSYHGNDDPFKCNMCGKQTESALALYVHIAKNKHP